MKMDTIKDSEKTATEKEKEAWIQNNGKYNSDKEIETWIEKDDELADKEREKWKHHIDSLFSLLGYIVGMGNIWRFPYLCMKNGGGAFLIPYFLFLFLCGMPLFYLEMIVGQFSSLSPIDVWKSVPLLQGVGWSYNVLCFLFSLYYNTILAWIIYYLFKSFTSKVPWATCDNWWNTPNCFRANNNESNTNFTISNSSYSGETQIEDKWMNLTQNFTRSSSPSEEFWNYEVLQLTSGIHDMGGVRWPLLGCLALSWLLVYVGIIKGIKSLSKALYVTVTLPYICLVILLIRGATLPGSVDGVLYYLMPNWGKLASFQVWGDACTQIFYTLGPGWGVVILMSSFNKFDYNCQRDAILLSTSCCMTSFFAGFVVFSVLGFMAKEMGVHVSEVVASGPGLVFVTYPEAISRLPLPPLWAIIFFFMLITIALDCQYGSVETISRSITDCYPNTLGKRRSLFTGLVCLVFFIAGIPFICRGGIYIFQVVDWYVAVFSLWLVAILETVAWGYIYGVNRVFDDVQIMVGRKPFMWWKICWCFITPVMLTAILLWSVALIRPPTYGDYKYPDWIRFVGWTISLAPTVPIVVLAVLNVYKEEGTLLQRLRILVSPRKEWGPALECHRAGTKYERNEMKIPMMSKTNGANGVNGTHGPHGDSLA